MRKLPLLIFAITYLPLAALANPYHDISESRKMKSITYSTRKNETDTGFQDGPWFPKNSSYGDIFRLTHGQMLLIKWINPSSKFKAPKKPKTGRDKFFASAFVTYSEATSGRLIDVSVFVVHPSYIGMYDSHLIPELAALEPPDLKIEQSQEKEFQGIKATVFWEKEDRCSILFKLPRHALLQISSPEACYKFEELKSLAETLNIPKLVRKLQE